MRATKEQLAHRAKIHGPAMEAAVGVASPSPTEYLLVADRSSKLLQSSTDRFEIIRLANVIRRGGGEVTVFKSTRM